MKQLLSSALILCILVGCNDVPKYCIVPGKGDSTDKRSKDSRILVVEYPSNKKMVELLKLKGVPVVSSANGYNIFTFPQSYFDSVVYPLLKKYNFDCSVRCDDTSCLIKLYGQRPGTKPELLLSH